MTDKTIFLVGPMGAGKSTIGRLLAADLSLPFIDSDREIEERAGVDIPWIFDREGEAGFRERESAVLADLALLKGVVIATGGGIIERAENRTLIAEHGFVVYLSTSVDEQLRRTAKDKRRPLLQRPDREDVLRTLLERRGPLYREVADLTIETNEFSPKQVVAQITQALGVTVDAGELE